MFAFYLDEEDGSVTTAHRVQHMERYQIRFAPARKPDEQDGAFRDRMRERQVLERGTAVYFPYEDSERGLLLLCGITADDAGCISCSVPGSVSWSRRERSMRRTVFSHISLLRTPKAQIGVSMANGLLELTVLSDAFSREELAEVLESYRRKKTYHRLRSGDFLELTGNAVTTVAELLAWAGA